MASSGKTEHWRRKPGPNRWGFVAILLDLPGIYHISKLEPESRQRVSLFNIPFAESLLLRIKPRVFLNFCHSQDAGNLSRNISPIPNIPPHIQSSVPALNSTKVNSRACKKPHPRFRKSQLVGKPLKSLPKHSNIHCRHEPWRPGSRIGDVGHALKKCNTASINPALHETTTCLP